MGEVLAPQSQDRTPVCRYSLGLSSRYKLPRERFSPLTHFGHIVSSQPALASSGRQWGEDGTEMRAGDIVAPRHGQSSPRPEIASHWKCSESKSSYRPAPPSPASTKGAQASGCANSAGCDGSSIAIIERRNASARPIAGSLANSAKAPVVSWTAAFDSTGQCETNRERAPA